MQLDTSRLLLNRLKSAAGDRLASENGPVERLASIEMTFEERFKLDANDIFKFETEFAK
jgi:hypothetical protein